MVPAYNKSQLETQTRAATVTYWLAAMNNDVKLYIFPAGIVLKTIAIMNFNSLLACQNILRQVKSDPKICLKFCPTTV